MQDQSEQVKCPICGKEVSANVINTHLDSNCSMNSAAPAKMAPLFKSPTKPQTTAAPVPTIKPAPFNTSAEGQLKQARAMDDGLTTAKRQKRDAAAASMPLAAKVRPVSLDEFVGQEELIGKGGVLRTLIESDRIPSMILWGGPGCGKTTLARIISKTTKSRFVELSATSHGAADVKKAFDEAKGHLALSGQRTIVFIDEIHRFTKAQQDLFLPYVEQGQIRLIGATTENPSFKVNAALLSRCRVFVLKQLSTDEIVYILTRALAQWRQNTPLPDHHHRPPSSSSSPQHEKTEKTTDSSSKKDLVDNSRTSEQIGSEKDAISFLANYSDGDARNALNTLEIALSTLPSKASDLKVETIKGAFQKSHLLYDRNGEEHYNIISALHKSIRGSDPDAGLYWLGRMLEAGEDPLYVARRLVRMASEDIGLADNAALPLAVAAHTSVEKIGRPECDVMLAQVVVYLAETKKSIRVYKAYNKVKEVIKSEPSHPVPMHIRNAPTSLMKNIGYGDGYRYNPDYEDKAADQTYLPEALIGRRFLEDE
ncbi:ATPase WRNIP1 [Absidia repens]|uniref:ATPase WRNIP1 n=1 Tax=Absidia repens TaxID=90262 RepID=A0A1X2IM92_9FUNG|nr:ATPase WRNIP1 [Absidia repens]